MGFPFLLGLRTMGGKGSRVLEVEERLQKVTRSPCGSIPLRREGQARVTLPGKQDRRDDESGRISGLMIAD